LRVTEECDELSRPLLYFFDVLKEEVPRVLKRSVVEKIHVGGIDLQGSNIKLGELLQNLDDLCS